METAYSGTDHPTDLVYRQALLEEERLDVLAWRSIAESPLEPANATEVEVPYTFTGKGRLICVKQSSQWLPISVPPAVIVPVPVVVV